MSEGPPLDMDFTVQRRSEMESQAYAFAERAANYAHDQTEGKTPRWEDMGAHGQASLMGQVLTIMAVKAVTEDTKVGSH